MSDEKAKLFKQIASQANEHVVLERMKLHGFWPVGKGIPDDPPDEAAERAALEKQLDELRKLQSKVKHPEKALAEERQRRWEESKARRSAKRAEREQESKERREAWAALRQTTLVHAGAGFSAGLQNTTSDAAQLESQGLPVLHTAVDLAAQMEISLASLRWLTFHRRGATLVHYHRYGIAKKTGGVRFISAPKPALKKAQGWILQNILAHLPPEGPAQGFVPFHSILTNAEHHVGKAVVVNMDLKDFFPSITFRRVKGLFTSFGYSEHLATVFALLCTEPPRIPAQLGDKLYHVALGGRVLPQGASTSPAITNLLCRKLDRRIQGLAKRHGFAFTRYADDLTFSGDNGRAVGRLLRSVRSILAEEGFTEHPTKTRVMRRANRQEVTGVVVNDRPTLPREEIRTLRAILHNAARHGLESQNRDNRPDFAAYLRGRIAFVKMIDPERGGHLNSALQRALAKD